MNYRKDSLFNTIGTFAYLGALWLMSVLSVRLGSFETVGYFSLAMTASNIYIAIASYTVRLYYAADIQKEFSDRQYFLMRGITTTISFFLCIVVSLLSGYSTYALTSVLVFYVFKIFEMMSDILYGAMQRQGKLYIAGVSMVIKSVLVLGLFILILAKSHELLYAEIAIAIGAALIFFFLDCLYCRRIGISFLPKGKVDLSAAGRLMWICFPLLIVGIFYNLIPSLPRLCFEGMYSTEEYGIFSSLSTVTVLISTAVNCVTIPFIPKMSEGFEKNDRKGFLQSILLLLGLTVVVGGTARLLSAVAGEWFLTTLFGETVRSYMHIFNLIILSTVITSIVIILNGVITAAKKQLWLLIGNLPGLLACLIFSTLFCKQYYMAGVCYVLILAQGVNMVSLSILSIIILSRIKENPRKQDEGTKTEA